MSRWFIVGLALAVLLIGISTDAATISVDPLGASGLPGDDLFNVGPVLSLSGGASGINVNAFTYGLAGPPVTPSVVYFSVDRAAVGAAGSAVMGQVAGAPAEGASADIFSSSPGSGTNALVIDGGSFGLMEPGAGMHDDIDALDGRPSSPTIFFGGTRSFWSYDAPVGPMSTADVIDSAPHGLGYPGVAGPYAAAGALGLAATDDIDGLEVFDIGGPGFGDVGDAVYFSLAPGSPSLAGFGVSPGDILVVTPGGAPVVAFTGISLGLAGTDNLNGFTFTAVPEPSTVATMSLAAIGFGLLHWRRGKKKSRSR